MSAIVNNGLLRDREVPEGFRTVFIETGYRKPGLSAKNCLMSVLEPTNETINVWSHVIALVLFMVRFYDVFNHTAMDDPWSYPLTTFAIGIAALMAMSSTAHLFNCISLSYHHIGFYLDYAAICVYSFSGAQAFFFYSRPANACSFFLLKSPNMFMLLSASLSGICTFVCCLSRHQWRKKGYIVRTSLFIIYFVIVTFPFTYRVIQGKEPETADSVHYFIRHIITYIISAMVNMFKIPERNFPGLFDFFGQSHHFLHLFAALGASDAFTAVYLDMTSRHQILVDAGTRGPDFYNTWFPFLLVVVINLTIVYWFAKSLLKEERRKTS